MSAPVRPPEGSRRAPIGRLFWKFFFFFWAAQLVTSVGVGVAVWALRPERAAAQFDEAPPPDFRPPPGAERPLPGAFRPPHGGPVRHFGPHFRPHHWHWPLVPLLAGGLVSLLFAGLLAWYFARPIRSLRTAFNEVAGGNLAARVGGAMGRRRDELVDLGKEFDHMADWLEALIKSQQRLLHDVSHELRSPLARLQAAVELMRQQPERAGELIDRIERDGGRIDELVGELLTLARLDAAGTRPQGSEVGEVVDLADLLAAITDDAEFEAAGEDGTSGRLATAFGSPLPVRGDRELLRRALENVVRNALRYSPRGAEPVSIAAQLVEPAAGAPRRVVVEVSDRGPGVPAAELEHIFEPFFRGAGAGSAAADGYGLGLAITRRVASAHGATVSAENRAGGGLRVRFEFPAA